MKFIVWTCFVLILVVMLGCSSGDTTDDTKAPDTVPKTLDPAKVSDIEQMSRAITNFDATLCLSITNEGIKQGCIDRVAKVKAIDAKDLAACDVITNAAIKNDCKNLVTQSLQNQANTNTPSVTGNDCSKFSTPEEIENCENIEKRTLALEQRSPELCSTITNGEMKTDCLDNVYQNLAIKAKDVTLCDKISLEEVQKGCRNNVYANKAFAEKNPALCNQITDQAFADACRSRLA